MNAFQIATVTALALLVVATWRGAARGAIRKRMAFVWLLIWIGAAVATIWPETTAVVAKKVGIGRGVDLVMYCGMFVMFIGFFYIYTRFRRLDHALTVLVRQLAIEHPVSRGPSARTGEPAPAPALRGGAPAAQDPQAGERP